MSSVVAHASRSADIHHQQGCALLIQMQAEASHSCKSVLHSEPSGRKTGNWSVDGRWWSTEPEFTRGGRNNKRDEEEEEEAGQENVFKVNVKSCSVKQMLTQLV